MARSDEIQYRYREILVDPDILSTFHHTSDSAPIDYSKRDELLDLTKELIDAVNYLILNRLTSRQSEVVQKIYYEQRTQMEVADSLGLCQTTIHKILKGNIDYLNGGKRYGGAIKKLKKLCATDPSILKITSRMAELREDLAD